MVVLDLPADPASIPLARHVAGTALLRAGVSRNCVGDLAVAASEALIHAFRHGEHTKGLRVTVDLTQDVVSIDVISTTAGVTTAGVTGRGPPRVKATRPPSAHLGGALMAAFSDRVVLGPLDHDIASVHISRRIDWTHDAPLREPSSAG